VFVKDGSESEEDCLKRVKNAIKNARPTNPLADKRDDDKRHDKKKKHGKDDEHDGHDREHARDVTPVKSDLPPI
jgi:hypothetical protein